MLSTHTSAFWRSIAGALVVGSCVALAAASPQDAAKPQEPAAKDGATIDETTLKTRTTPISCTANQTVDLDGALLKVDSGAIVITGNCQVHVSNSRVVARAAVAASGNASVTFENCIVEGALSLTGNAVVSFKQSTVRGAGRRLQSAGKVKDLGHNVWK
jgi:hypothetical protein